MSDYAPQGFRMLPPVVKNLIIINVICWLAELVLLRTGNGFLVEAGYLCSLTTGQFHIWQLITYMFMHDPSNFSHILFNMFALWMFGYVLENYWGSRRFLIYYLVCGIGAGLLNILIPISSATVGASGAIYGILLAFGMMFPNERIYLYFFVPIKAKWFVIIYAALELFEGFGLNDGVAHFAHLGGMLFGLILILYWKKHPFSRF